MSRRTALSTVSPRDSKNNSGPRDHPPARGRPGAAHSETKSGDRRRSAREDALDELYDRVLQVEQTQAAQRQEVTQELSDAVRFLLREIKCGVGGVRQLDQAIHDKIEAKFAQRQQADRIGQGEVDLLRGGAAGHASPLAAAIASAGIGIGSAGTEQQVRDLEFQVQTAEESCLASVERLKASFGKRLKHETKALRVDLEQITTATHATATRLKQL